MIEVSCSYEPPHTHTYPDDWIFSGASRTDPRGDTRFQPTTYEYYDDKAQRIHVTQVPLCDDQAIDEFTKVADYGAGFNPVWLSAKRPNGKVEMLPWIYNKATDEVSPR